jgi:hypothetical protein
LSEAAIVTLAIGDEHLSQWRKYCEPTWRAYATKHRHDLIVIDQPLDSSARAAERSMAWQKCLVLSQDFAAKYDYANKTIASPMSQNSALS